MDVTAPRRVRVGAMFWLRCTFAVLVRPKLWIAAVRTLARSTPPGWWRRWPFIPVPDPAFLRFRLDTAYGHGGSPRVRDFLAYLHWVHERA